MTFQRMWIAVLAAAIVFMVSTAWSQHAVTRARSVAVPMTAHTTTVIESVAPAVPYREDEAVEPRLDLNGNQVDDAVGDYRIDPRGEMYERHAPDTALLHLSAPEL
jgi:hypothetical protein